MFCNSSYKQESKNSAKHQTLILLHFLADESEANAQVCGLS